MRARARFRFAVMGWCLSAILVLAIPAEGQRRDSGPVVSAIRPDAVVLQPDGRPEEITVTGSGLAGFTAARIEVDGRPIRGIKADVRVDRQGSTILLSISADESAAGVTGFVVLLAGREELPLRARIEVEQPRSGVGGGFSPRSASSSPLAFTGQRFTPPTASAGPLVFIGQRFTPPTASASPLVFTGLRFEPRRAMASPLVFIGRGMDAFPDGDTDPNDFTPQRDITSRRIP